ncbi:MAG TPA: MFS transporter [Candidatus Limnocylindrales bacterium]|nr:MFS transporter [Candidatus Limnocylindrales bacterium]
MDKRSSDPAIAGAYPGYALFVLVLVYVFNFLDRQILSILNDHIKADLGLNDAQMGFLFGTAFAVFYALFGIPLGRLADMWTRRTLIAIGLAFWSTMTALSGLARNFTEIAAARIGVGVGEASASPAAYSLLSDYFSPARRATAMAVYSSGIYIGAGLGLMLGGQIVDRWDAAWAGTTPPGGLRGWQVAFFAVGLPGLLLAVLVRTLREPQRPALPASQIWREFGRELSSVIPPLTLMHLHGVGGAAAVRTNLVLAAVVAAAAWGMVRLTGDGAQWTALGVGVYAALSWTQSLRLRNPRDADIVLGMPTLRWIALGFGFLSFGTYGIGYWVAPFFLRKHGVSTAEVGLYVGGAAAAAGWLGVTMGGAIADWWHQRSRYGRLYTGLVSAVLPFPLLLVLIGTDSKVLAYSINVPLTMTASMWIGAGISTVHDLVPARLRGTAGAAYLLVLTFVGLALGPYGMGKFSILLGGLAPAMLTGGAIAGVLGVLFLLLAVRSLEADHARIEGA